MEPVRGPREDPSRFEKRQRGHYNCFRVRRPWKSAARVETALSILFCVFALSLAGCATFEDNFPGSSLSQDNFPPWDSPPGTAGQAPYRSREEITQPPTADEKAVLASAQTLIGMAPESVVKVNGRTFVLDCIGTVSAIFYGMSIDVQRDFRRYRGDGVGRLYQSLAGPARPSPGPVPARRGHHLLGQHLGRERATGGSTMTP